MNFAFNEEQKSLGATLGQALSDFPALTAPDPHDGRDPGVWTALAELGLFSLLVPEAEGGMGLTLVDVALAVEAMGAELAPPIVASTLIATDIIALHGNEQQKASWLPQIAEGGMKIAIAVLEAGQGYDPEDVQTRIARDGVTGRKILVGDADQAEAFLVLARNEGKPCLAIIRQDARGVSLRQHDDLDPSSGFSEVILDAASMTDDALISPNAPDAAIDRLIDVASTVYAGMQIGIAARMLDASVDYAKTRVQFAQPIGAFQSIKHRCADMAVAIEAGRSAAYYAFWAVAEDAPDRGRAASMAKAYCGESARDVCNQAIQLHGGMGFTWELGLHRFLRRAKVLEHGFGNHVWHYERVLAASLAPDATLRAPQAELVD